MSQYDGPVFQKKQHQKNKNRRFNQLNSANGSHRVFEKKHEPASKEHTPLAQYELPDKLKKLKQQEAIAQPIDAHRLKDKIERNQLNQLDERPEKYHVAYLEKEEAQDKTFTNAKEMSQMFEKINKSNKITEKQIYQTAFAQNQVRDKNNDPKEETKSLSNKEIRAVSQRLIKDKDSFLLLDEE